MLDIETSFGSNICRCTGYRPILAAFKKFAKDAPRSSDLLDIEDLRICDKKDNSCNRKQCDDNTWCIVNKEDVNKTRTAINLKDGRVWYSVETLADIFEILELEGDDSYMLVAGNTAKGMALVKLTDNWLNQITNYFNAGSFIFRRISN